MAKKFYGKGIPGVKTSELKGKLIVIEGGDGSGRGTQSLMLRNWLEKLGYPTSEAGLRRSELVGEHIAEAKEGNMLCPITFSLFYATDFADQLENSVLPALRAGFIVVADRYIYTPMARDTVRGADPEWLRGVYGLAVIPDLILHLEVSPQVLAERIFAKAGVLDYWEAGMDIQRSQDMYECFINYQTQIAEEYRKLGKEFGFISLNGEQSPELIQNSMQKSVSKALGIKASA